MKLKECSKCGKVGPLWKAKPYSCCKECWLKIKAQESSSPSDSSKTLQKTKSRSYRIKSVSDKKLVELKEYRKKRDMFMKGKLCEFPDCKEKATDLHHKKSRAYHLCDESIFMAVCRNHHMWIHENDAKAREMGFLLSSLNK